MPRFYSAEWVDTFNRAVSGLDGAAPSGAQGAGGGDFRLLQVIRDAPPEVDPDEAATLRILLEVTGGRMALRRIHVEDGSDRADVTVLLDYADAVALSTGTLDPPSALGAGRIRVRGNLAVLVSGQALLAAATPLLGPLREATTY